MKMVTHEELCCCEYENVKGEKSHLLASCCECDALDEMADRCTKCQKIPTSTVNRFVDTVIDRCRVPGLLGGGAKRVSPEIATPIFVLPISLAIAAHGPIITVIVLLFLPFFCSFFYYTWKRKTNKSRTKFFFVWALTSVALMFILFESVICKLGGVSYMENAVVTACVIGMMYAMILSKRDPGIIARERIVDENDELLNSFHVVHIEDCDIPQDLHEIKSDMYSREHLQEMQVAKNPNERQESGCEHISGRDNNWDGHSVVGEGGRDEKDTSHRVIMVKAENWCDVCQIEKPLRTGHCTVCRHCVARRDHHCVWIDTCVGQNNHCTFLVAMVMFIVAGYYGSYLTLRTVCISSADSRCSITETYKTFKFALCYVSAWYTILVTVIMTVGLVHQLILISQNLTSQELHHAVRRRETCFLVFAINNSNNLGVIQNWLAFIRTFYSPVGANNAPVSQWPLQWNCFWLKKSVWAIKYFKKTLKKTFWRK